MTSKNVAVKQEIVSRDMLFSFDVPGSDGSADGEAKILAWIRKKETVVFLESDFTTLPEHVDLEGLGIYIRGLTMIKETIKREHAELTKKEGTK